MHFQDVFRAATLRKLAGSSMVALACVSAATLAAGMSEASSSPAATAAGPSVSQDGSKYWFRDGQLHREDGPAVERANGGKEWYRDGKPHRDDGPAIERANGTKAWYRDGKLHREDGPAIEYASGTKVWYRDGQLHRDDGPAVEDAHGHKEWWRDGQPVSPPLLPPAAPSPQP